MNLPNTIQTNSPTLPSNAAPALSGASSNANASAPPTQNFGVDFAQIMASQFVHLPSIEQQSFASSQSLSQSLQVDLPSPSDAQQETPAANSTPLPTDTPAVSVMGTNSWSSGSASNAAPAPNTNVTAATADASNQTTSAASQASPPPRPHVVKRQDGNSTLALSMPAFLPLSLPTDSNATVPASNVTSSNATSNFAPLTNLNELTPNVSTNQFNATGNISLPVATMTSSPLQTVAVSQNLSVLTPTQQSTNTQSLTAFAQSMGLDDNAIAQLLSKAQAPQTPNANSGLSTNAITLASGTQTLTNTNTSPSAITPSSTLMAALSMQGHNGNATLAGSSTIMLQATPPTALPPNTASVPMAHQLLNAGNQFSNSGAATNVTSPPINTNSTIPLATNIPPNSANLTITAATSPQVQMAAYNVGTTASVKTDQGALDSESTVIDTGLSESDLPKLSASLGIELPVISATPAQTDTGAQSGSNSSNNPASLMGMGTEATQSNTSNTAQSSEASASISDIDQQEKYDQLNTRLATEMASRINQQLSAGQWKMKFGLRPANLGGVEVQLEMSDGKLNANFNAENPTTANLLQNASAHLRSSLENFGIQAGQVQVGTNAGGGQQNPSQQSPNTSQFVDNSGVQENSSQEETTEQPTSGRQDSSSGLDLYA